MSYLNLPRLTFAGFFEADVNTVNNDVRNYDSEVFEARFQTVQKREPGGADYTSLLNALHWTFNGQPEMIGNAMGLMYQLRLAAQDVLSTPLPNDPDMTTGLCFRWQPTTAETT